MFISSSSSSSSIPIGPHVVSLSGVTRLTASCRPLKPNKRRRRCAPLLDSQIPLVHGTQTTEAGRVGAEIGTAAQRKLICSLTDGSPSHTQPPDCQPASHVGAEQVGEGARAEGRMIVIEYEMSISWNKRATQARGNILPALTYTAVCLGLWFTTVTQQPSVMENTFVPLKVRMLWTCTSDLMALSVQSLFLVFIVSY